MVAALTLAAWERQYFLVEALVEETEFLKIARIVQSLPNYGTPSLSQLEEEREYYFCKTKLYEIVSFNKVDGGWSRS